MDRTLLTSRAEHIGEPPGLCPRPPPGPDLHAKLRPMGGDLLWEPPAELVERAVMTRFMRAQGIDDYDAL